MQCRLSCNVSTHACGELSSSPARSDPVAARVPGVLQLRGEVKAVEATQRALPTRYRPEARTGALANSVLATHDAQPFHVHETCRITQDDATGRATRVL